MSAVPARRARQTLLNPWSGPFNGLGFLTVLPSRSRAAEAFQNQGKPRLFHNHMKEKKKYVFIWMLSRGGACRALSPRDLNPRQRWVWKLHQMDCRVQLKVI